MIQVRTRDRVGKTYGEVAKLMQDYSRKSGGLQKLGCEVLQAAKDVLAPRAELIRKAKELLVVRPSTRYSREFGCRRWVLDWALLPPNVSDSVNSNGVEWCSWRAGSTRSTRRYRSCGSRRWTASRSQVLS